MSRIPPVDPATAPPEVKRLYGELQGLGFEVLNVFRMFANHPPILEGFSRLGMALYGNAALAARYRELAYLRASQINACHY